MVGMMVVVTRLSAAFSHSPTLGQEVAPASGGRHGHF